MRAAAEDVEAPLQRLEHTLHPWVAFAIVPLFALANAGVELTGHLASHLTNRVTLGVVLGLVVGKQVGITLFSWSATRLGFATLPAGLSWSRSTAPVGWAGSGSRCRSSSPTSPSPAGTETPQSEGGDLGASILAGVVGWVLMRGRAGSRGRRAA